LFAPVRVAYSMVPIMIAGIASRRIISMPFKLQNPPEVFHAR
jgi:hypothetical protein